MSGKLYLCATPIGNLEDMTFRVIKILKEVDVIAAEDTRNSIKLLNHYEIKTPMTSYHEFNKVEKGKYLVDLMLQGKHIALITDAGTPGISDPGEELVKMCQAVDITVTSLPGCCALITGLTLSGLSTRRFCFEGFLPIEKKERQYIMNQLAKECRTIILYEAPHRLVKTLEILHEILGNRKITLTRELTKKFETVFSTTIQEAIDFYREATPKGEFVLVIEGLHQEDLEKEEREKWLNLSIPEHMEYYLEKEIDKKTAMKYVAKDRGITKREVYQYLLNKED